MRAELHLCGSICCLGACPCVRSSCWEADSPRTGAHEARGPRLSVLLSCSIGKQPDGLVLSGPDAGAARPGHPSLQSKAKGRTAHTTGRRDYLAVLCAEPAPTLPCVHWHGWLYRRCPQSSDRWRGAWAQSPPDEGVTPVQVRLLRTWAVLRSVSGLLVAHGCSGQTVDVRTGTQSALDEDKTTTQ